MSKNEDKFIGKKEKRDAKMIMSSYRQDPNNQDMASLRLDTARSKDDEMDPGRNKRRDATGKIDELKSEKTTQEARKKNANTKSKSPKKLREKETEDHGEQMTCEKLQGKATKMTTDDDVSTAQGLGEKTTKNNATNLAEGEVITLIDAVVTPVSKGATKMSWFKKLMGFKETSPDEVRSNLILDGDRLTSRVNGMTFRCGTLETPTLKELRDRVDSVATANSTGQLTLKEVVGNVQDLHADVSNAGAIFQVASQFNLLEMVSPDRTPEDGVGIYERDRTQGPACAIAAGAGTIFRNYLADVNGYIGQSSKNQIDCLADIGEELDNTDNRLWEMKNGYALATKGGLKQISTQIKKDKTYKNLMGLLRIGIQSNTQVTIFDSKHTVTQAYCSALPVSYCQHAPDLWEDFARLVLDASYEAAICAAILNAVQTGNNRVFLTLVGGGAFGNDVKWITKAILRALRLYQHHNLDVAIVSYGESNKDVRAIVKTFSKH